MLNEQTQRPKTVHDLRTLYDLAIYNCSLFGSFKQVIFDDLSQEPPREYTNIAIAREATQLAAGLRALGIEKGDRVIVMLPNCPEVIIAYQAIARAGAVVIPVLPLLKGPEVHYIASNSGAKAIITGAILVPLVRQALSDVSTLRAIVSVGTSTSASPTMLAYRDVVEKGADQADRFMHELEGVSVSPDDTAVILYTSGTTGNPKGVMLSHRSLVSNALSGFGEDRDPKAQFGQMQLAILPLAHAYGILISNISYLSGAIIVMLPRFEAGSVLAAIERYHIIGFAGVPAMFVALLYTPDADKYDTSSLQYCVSGSAPLPVEILRGFEQKFHCEIREGYGLSEASAALTGHGADMPRKPGSVGVPISGVELRIVDEHDTSLSTGEIGEILARGPNIMQSYYNMPEETAKALRDGWLHTGDMGYLDEDGYLYVVERKKDLIIRGGFNIYPRDVEEVLAAHPAVIEAAVVGIPSERMGEEVKAFVVTRIPVSAEDLMIYCREQLANYKTPSQIAFVHALPRNAVGKIDKKELRKNHVN
jgi:long-chain acyl-CoA synthetase